MSDMFEFEEQLLLSSEMIRRPKAANKEQNYPSSIKPRRSFKNSLNLFGKAGILALALIGLATIGHSAFGKVHEHLQLYQPESKEIPTLEHLEQSSPDKSCTCGESIEEALANNCAYDSLATAWLPPHCRDDELNEEWLRAGPNADGSWDYFTDQDGTTKLSLDEVAALANTPGSFWVTMEWHVKHCAFLWRKEYRIKTGLSKAKMDMRNDGLHHIGHCEQMMLLRDPLQDLNTESQVTLNADRGHV
ncbi:MAG: hypothetical protein MMC33_003593 [Icmadophila ericetorum]|nr:hypothetical protein [Icmadophila ericetorum]